MILYHYNFVIVFHALFVLLNAQTDSPCPDVLKYTNKTDSRWNADISLNTKRELEGVWLELQFDKPLDALTADFGKVTTADNTHYAIKDVEKLIEANVTVAVGIDVGFDKTKDAPNLIIIRFNGKTICANTTEADFKKALIARSGYQNVFSNISLRGLHCGRIAPKGAALITLGVVSKEGNWPWHVALFWIKTKKNYICGGSLITEKHVLTASHCVHDYINQRILRKPEDFLVTLGITDLKKKNDYAIDRTVMKIDVPENYNHSYLRNDIAVMTLTDKVTFNDYIRPVCLWSGGINKPIVGKIGTAVGWGLNENDTFVDDLREVKMPVIDQATCIYSNRDFFSRFTSENSFCAGFNNGTSVCNGDSGGALVFNTVNVDGERAWEVRGIVSVSLASKKNLCDPYNYTVFTDVAYFIDWISDKIQ